MEKIREMQFAEMIKKARKQADLSQRGLAKLLISSKKPDGVWATYVGQIEKGEKIPSDDVCIKLAEVLHLDSDMVLLAAY
jgi:transcriptional regulator with XRE-family HTH domain